MEELADAKQVISYVKNAYLGFAIPYTHEGKDKQYFADFIARCKTKDKRIINLIIEVTGMNKDKAVKKNMFLIVGYPLLMPCAINTNMTNGISLKLPTT